MFKRLSISYKISLIAFIGLIGFAIFLGVNYQLSLEIRNRLSNLVAEEFPILQFSNYVQVNFNELDKLYQAALTESDIDTLLEADQKADDIEAEFTQIESNYKISSTSFYKMSSLFKRYRQSISLHTRQVIEQRLTYDQVIEGYTQIGLIREELLSVQSQFLANRYQSFSLSLYNMEEDEQFIVEFGLVLGIILLISLGVVSALIITRITSAFRQGVDFAHSIAAGNLDVSIDTKETDETGQLVQSLNAMRQVLKKQLRMNQGREREQLFLAGLNDVMRGDPRLQDLAENVCQYLLRSMPSIYALGFYLREDKDNFVILDVQGQGKHTSINALFDNTLSTKEGRASQSIKTKSIIQFNDTAPGVNLNAVCQHWLYFPIVLENEVKAILVLACDMALDADSQYLLNLANNALSIALDSAQARNEVANMLKQTQLQARVLTKQQTELALINEQLEIKTIDLDTQRNEILEKNNLLELSQKALLEKSDALEVSGRYKSQFLSTMSHELRTPLNSILLLSEALLENCEQRLSEKQVRHADVIHNAGSELLSLINDILDLSKVEEGKMELVVDAISPVGFIQRLHAQSEELVHNKKLSLNIEFSDNLPNLIYVDEHRLYQILKNFISNALKFTEVGGVTISVANHIDSISDEALVCFKVTDTGVGIDPRKQEVVFEAFKQADGTTSRKFGGTGLGLTISRELAILLGGRVDLYSEGLGYGSSFMVYIPVGNEADLSVDNTVASLISTPASLVLEILPLLESFPLPTCLPSDSLVFLSMSTDWKNLVLAKAELSPIKLSFIDNTADLSKVLNYQIPKAFVIDSDSEVLVDALVSAKLNVPVFSVGDSLSVKLSTEVEVLRWFDQHHLNQIIERVLNSADQSLSRVLFVEDNPVFQEVIRSVFAKQGLQVDLVADAESAMKAVYQTTYELLVVDLNLPDFSGEQVMQAIRRIPTYTEKNMVLFTAEDLQANYKASLLQYADEIVFKSPQAINELALKALQLIKRSKNKVYTKQSSLNDAQQGFSYKTGALKGRKVLLVDDDERNLYSLGCALESEDIIVYQAQSGFEALEVLGSDEQVDLILLDIMMPDMDGYEVLSRIRHNPSWSFLPVIALTAKAMMGDKQRCLDAGASDYLSKPVSLQNLLDKMLVYLS